MMTLITLLLTALLAAPPAAPSSDLVLLYNGHMMRSPGVGMGRNQTLTRYADAALISKGRFVAVGTLQEIETAAARFPDKPRRIDLHGRFALGGLTDAHGHVSGLGFSLQRLRFEGTTSADEIAKMVAAEAKKRPAGEWILGRGWDQNDWAVKAFPTHEILDRVASDRPVWLRRVDGHAGWANAKALEIAGVTRETKDPDGGRIERGADGAPTGVLVDNAMSLVDHAVPQPTRAQTRDAIVRALEHCARLGLTAVHDAGIDTMEVSIYRELADSGGLPIRVRAMLSAEYVTGRGSLPVAKITAGDDMFRLFAVKAYADGALGSRGAALLAPYSDDTTNTGLLRIHPDELEKLARLCLAAGYPLCVHAIGDRGNRMALDAFEQAAGSAGVLRPARFRIEHAQVVAPADFARFGRLGVIASMQPTHCTSDMPWAPDRLGPERVRGAYAWRRMLDAGVRMCFGSDFPVEDPNPLLGIYAALTTQDLNGKPPEGYRPDEKLTIEETIYAFTMTAAYAASEDDRRGRIDPGMEADVTVFDRDLTAVPVTEIPKASCVMTMVGGRVVWDASAKTGVR